MCGLSFGVGCRAAGAREGSVQRGGQSVCARVAHVMHAKELDLKACTLYAVLGHSLCQDKKRLAQVKEKIKQSETSLPQCGAADFEFTWP